MLRTFRYAMFFDGVDDYVSVPHNPSLALSRLSICVWVNVPEYQPDYRSFVTKNTFGTFNYFFGTYYERIRVAWRSSLNVWGDRIEWYIPAGFYGVFHYLAATIGDVGEPVNISCDGSLVKTATATAQKAVTYTEPLYVGYVGTGVPYFHGFISQILIYSRLLSSSEIQQNYNCSDNPIRNGLVLWFKAGPAYVKDIDGDGILEWIDLSGFGNHGKIYGAQLVQLIKDASRILQAQRVLSCAR
jgi:hypothetical protein